MRRRPIHAGQVPLTVESLDAFTTVTGMGLAEWRSHRLGWARAHRDLLPPLDALLGYLHVAGGRQFTPFSDGTRLRSDGARVRTT